VTKKVKKYIEGYDAYQRNKNCIEAPAEKLMPNTVLEKLYGILLPLGLFMAKRNALKRAL